MKKIVLTVILCLFSSIAFTAEQPSMLGLRWGDSVENVNKKLRELNMKYMPKTEYDKYAPNNLDYSTYYGKVLDYQGYLTVGLKNSKLMNISILFESKNTPFDFFHNLELVMHEKYGEPYFSFDFNGDGHDDNIEWRLKNIDTMISLTNVDTNYIHLSYYNLEYQTKVIAENRKNQEEKAQQERQKLKTQL